MNPVLRFIINLILACIIYALADSEKLFLYMSNRYYINNVENINGHLYDFDSTQFIRNSKPITVKCRLHNFYFKTKPNKLHKKNILVCPKCIEEYIKKHPEKFKTK